MRLYSITSMKCIWVGFLRRLSCCFRHWPETAGFCIVKLSSVPGKVTFWHTKQVAAVPFALLQLYTVQLLYCLTSGPGKWASCRVRRGTWRRCCASWPQWWRRGGGSGPPPPGPGWAAAAESNRSTRHTGAPRTGFSPVKGQERKIRI